MRPSEIICEAILSAWEGKKNDYSLLALRNGLASLCTGIPSSVCVGSVLLQRL